MRDCNSLKWSSQWKVKKYISLIKKIDLVSRRLIKTFIILSVIKSEIPGIPATLLMKQ